MQIRKVSADEARRLRGPALTPEMKARLAAYRGWIGYVRNESAEDWHRRVRAYSWEVWYEQRLAKEGQQQ